MKKIFTLLVSFFLTLSLFAADGHRSGMLTIRSFDNADMKVVIDGRRFEPSQNVMTVRNIDAGYHYVKIYKARRSGFFTIYNTRYEMVFNGNISVRPKTSLTLSVDRFGRTSISENRMFGGYDDRNRDWDNDRRYDNTGNCDYDFDNGPNMGDYGDRDRNFDNRNYNDRDYNNRNSNDKQFDDRDRNNNGGWKDNRNYNSGYESSKAMNDADFDMLLNNISKERFENNMMKSATQVISTSYFTTAQVKELLQLFSFESNKLDLAKKAYEKTVDQRNYYMINDVFNFNSSKDELNRYITQR